MWYEGRIYFISDRDGMMNLWSMATDGSDVTQHTEHEAFDVRYANISNGIIVYQMAADLWKYDVASDESTKIPIRLATDLDQRREKWDENPSRYITSIHPNKNGDQIVITARGRVFVVPTKMGRSVAFTNKRNVRYREATFAPDGKHVISLSDESGEFEFVKLPSNGIGALQQITNDGKVLRYAGVPSPDGKWIAYDDLENNMFVLNMASGHSLKIFHK